MMVLSSLLLVVTLAGGSASHLPGALAGSGADTGATSAVADVLTRKAVSAATELGVATLLIAGGVAANSRLRELAAQRCAAAGLAAATAISPMPMSTLTSISRSLSISQNQRPRGEVSERP